MQIIIWKSGLFNNQSQKLGNSMTSPTFVYFFPCGTFLWLQNTQRGHSAS